jgi:spermidine/putrescine transport system ATP-binding protein
MSDRIAVMNAGRIEQIGEPADIYEHPATRFVAEFIGRMNFFSGEVTPAREVRTARGLIIAVPVPAGIANGAAVHVAVRPERSRLSRDKPEGGLALRGTVRQVLYLGSTREFHLDLDGGERGLVEMPNDGSAVPFDAGAPVWLAASFENCLVLPARS